MHRSYQTAPTPSSYVTMQSNSKMTNFYSKAKQFCKVLLTKAHILSNSQRRQRLQEKKPNTEYTSNCSYFYVDLRIERYASYASIDFHDLGFSNWMCHKYCMNNKETIAFRVKFKEFNLTSSRLVNLLKSKETRMNADELLSFG